MKEAPLSELTGGILSAAVLNVTANEEVIVSDLLSSPFSTFILNKKRR